MESKELNASRKLGTKRFYNEYNIIESTGQCKQNEICCN